MSSLKYTNGLVKVVRENGRSALLTVSPWIVDYTATMNGSNLFVAPPNPSVPLICFDGVASAEKFCAKHPDRSMYAATAVGDVLPIQCVLKIKNAGWEENALRFWGDFLSGKSLFHLIKNYDTIECPAGSVAVFGLLKLGTLLRAEPKVEKVKYPAHW